MPCVQCNGTGKVPEPLGDGQVTCRCKVTMDSSYWAMKEVEEVAALPEHARPCGIEGAISTMAKAAIAQTLLLERLVWAIEGEIMRREAGKTETA